MFMFFGIVFTIILGVLLHYTFEWSGRNLLVAFLAPTSESYFEHLKLLLTPYLLWLLAEYVYYGQFMHAFIPAKVLSLYAGMFLMVALHLAYETLLTAFAPHPSKSAAPHPTKRSAVWGSILVFILAVVATFMIGEFLMTLTFLDSAGVEILADAVLVFTIIAFAALTIYPPRGWLFQAR